MVRYYAGAADRLRAGQLLLHLYGESDEDDQDQDSDSSVSSLPIAPTLAQVWRTRLAARPPAATGLFFAQGRRRIDAGRAASGEQGRSRAC